MRILIVEDDRALASGLKRSLASLGYAVDHEADAADALGLATREAYNLVVLDLGLPNGSGYDVLRAIRRAGLKTPVMILTARDHVSEKVKALDLGADDYVNKPFALAEFEARVRAAGAPGLRRQRRPDRVRAAAVRYRAARGAPGGHASRS